MSSGRCLSVPSFTISTAMWWPTFVNGCQRWVARWVHIPIGPFLELMSHVLPNYIQVPTVFISQSTLKMIQSLIRCPSALASDILEFRQGLGRLKKLRIGQPPSMQWMFFSHVYMAFYGLFIGSRSDVFYIVPIISPFLLYSHYILIATPKKDPEK